MELHKNESVFKELIEIVSNDIGLLPFQVEKDYYVSFMLKEISKIIDVEIIFKGGTSLSKCYDIIHRFSEDIDLAVKFDGEKLNRNNRKKLKKSLIEVIDKLEFDLLNEQHIQSDKDYNKYEVGYQKLFKSDTTMVDHIIIETIAVYKPYPCETHKVRNYISNYLYENGLFEIIKEYDLEPFEMTIQSIDRTFIDKIFAVCDYHLQKNYLRYSRHIYDLHRIWKSGLLKMNKVNDIVEEVIKDRQLFGKSNLSCMPGQKPNELLKEIYNNHVYKDDYNDITTAFIYKPVDYFIAIESIKEIYESNIIPLNIKNYK